MDAIETRRGAGALSPFRMSPFLSQDPVFRRMERMFDEAVADAFGGLAPATGQRETGFFQPHCDIDETREAYMVTMDVPGLRKEDISIEIEGNVLVVSGERRKEAKEAKGNERYVERRYGRFERRFSLPQEIAPENVQASYKDGELRLVLPKSMQEKRRRIELSDADMAPNSRLAGDDRMVMQGTRGTRDEGDMSSDRDPMGKPGMHGARGEENAMDGQAPN